jgi:hypothetical protein
MRRSRPRHTSIRTSPRAFSRKTTTVAASTRAQISPQGFNLCLNHRRPT